MKDVLKNNPKAIQYTILILIPLILLALRLTLSPTLPGAESYLHLATAESLTSLSPNLYHNLLSLSPFLLSIILPSILTILTLLILPSLLSKLGLDSEIRNLSMIMLIFTPFYLSLIYFSSPLPLILLITVASIYLMVSGTLRNSIIATLLLATIPFMGRVYAICTIILLISFAVAKKKTCSHAPFIAIFLTLQTVILQVYYKYPMPQLLPRISNLFVELGSWYGLSLFYLLLAILGLLYLWKKKKSYYSLFIFLIIIATITLWIPEASIYLYIPIHILAAFGLLSVMTSTWELPRLKKLSLYLIIIGIIIANVTFLSTIAKTSPHPEQIEALEWLLDDEPHFYTVLSHPSRNYWIQAIAQKKTITNPEELLHTRNLEKAIQLISQSEIEYIFIDEEMKNGLVWNQPDEGLLFLLRNDETFKNVYSDQGVEIWQVK